MSQAARTADRLLAARWDLEFVETGETVDDVEALIRGVLGAERWPCFLSSTDEADLVGQLLGDAVLLERQYRRRDGIEARPWLFQRLKWKARDWRRVYLRHRVPLDAADRVDAAAVPDIEEVARDRDHGRSRPDGAPDPAAGDRGDHGLDALRRLLESGDRPLLREVAALGVGAPPGARGRTQAARRGLARLDRTRRRHVADLDQALTDRLPVAA